jgi:hypothetical protein
MLAIQHQVISTRNYAKYIIKDKPIIYDTCRLCNQKKETIDHITGGCSTLANKEYTNRHDNVTKQIHQQLALKYKLVDSYTPYYTYKPVNVLENHAVKLYWDRDIITDRTISCNRPDITLTIKSSKTTYLIDISKPNTENLRTKHNEKIQKYVALSDEVKQMWHQNTVKIVPIILSSTGLIPKSLHTAIQTIELNKFLHMKLQKSVILDTSNIVRRFFNYPTS